MQQGWQVGAADYSAPARNVRPKLFILRGCACSREVTSALLTAVHNLLERLTPSRPLPALAACVLLDMPLLDDPEHSGHAVARIRD